MKFTADYREYQNRPFSSDPPYIGGLVVTDRVFGGLTVSQVGMKQSFVEKGFFCCSRTKIINRKFNSSSFSISCCLYMYILQKNRC